MSDPRITIAYHEQEPPRRVMPRLPWQSPIEPPLGGPGWYAMDEIGNHWAGPLPTKGEVARLLPLDWVRDCLDDGDEP